MSIQNLATYDPFADTGENEDNTPSKKIHIRVKQRNGRKCVTTIEGLPQDLRAIKRLLKYLKKNISVGGSIEQDDDVGYVIQLQGKSTTELVDYLVTSYGFERSLIEVHGAI